MHFPWCAKKCPYCDFNSHAVNGDIPEQQYIDALISDLSSQWSEVTEPRSLVSIFLGGGTPSLFSAGAIADLLAAISQRFDLTDTEITLEANPGTFDQAQFSGYRAAGVNRISIGVQSFDDRQLQQLGRIHRADAAKQAYKGAVNAGFERINIDLMYGLPGQSLSSAMSDLQQAIELEPEHLSWYQLTIEPNTVFYNQPPLLPQIDDINDMMDRGFELTKSAGYHRYEISAYAQAGGEAQHNLNYWQFGDYLGVGAGAHGKLTIERNIVRTTKSRVPKDYLAAPEQTRQLSVAKDQLPTEFLMNALRLAEGFTLSQFEVRTGLSRDAIQGFITRAKGKGLIDCSGELIRPSQRGLDFLNESLLLVDD